MHLKHFIGFITTLLSLAIQAKVEKLQAGKVVMRLSPT